jgi:hypothetical protein
MIVASTRKLFVGILAITATPHVAAAQTGCAGAVSGAKPCAQVEERLRLDPRARRDISPWGMPNAFAPIGEGGISPAHQRLEGGYGMNAPRLR